MKPFLKIFFFILSIVTYVFCSQQSLASSQLWDEFPLVRDSRNFKENKGGKSVPAQGALLLRPQDTTLFLNEGQLQDYHPSTQNWRYVVAMNCRRGDRPLIEILREVQTKLISQNKRDRLGLIIGINERVTVETPLNYAPSWTEILGTEDIAGTFHEITIPVFFVYFQWTSFRESVTHPHLTPLEIRERLQQRLLTFQNPRQRKVASDKLLEQDLSQQFPYGKARQFLLQNIGSQGFIQKMHQGGCGVYVHIQDSDFISYEESLMFGNYQGPTPLIPSNTNRLLEKYDEVIAHSLGKNRHLPIIVGGAHVYSPTEDLTTYLDHISADKLLKSPASKYWTRFTSELGNNIKHLCGQQHPYGLYFHEPNTLVLSPYSAALLKPVETTPEWETLYERLTCGFQFGIDSEVQDFTRTLFKGTSDEVCRQAMVFSSSTVLSTSMKRGSKPFTIKFKGTFDPKTNRFEGCTKADLSALRGMSQETICTNDWGSAISTSFYRHRIKDARKLVYQALKEFDPIYHLDPTKKASFSLALVTYEALPLSRKSEIQTLFHNLQARYNKLRQGHIIAEQIITAGWESGQIMRLMLLDHLQPPEGLILPATSQRDQHIRDFLAWRLNNQTNPGAPLQVRNPFVVELLTVTPGIKILTPHMPARHPLPLPDIKPKQEQPPIHTPPQNAVQNPVQNHSQAFTVTQTKVTLVVNYLYEKHGNNASQTARDLKVDRKTIPKLREGNAPRAWKGISKLIDSAQKVRQHFDKLGQLVIDEIIRILSGAI